MIDSYFSTVIDLTEYCKERIDALDKTGHFDEYIFSIEELLSIVNLSSYLTSSSEHIDSYPNDIIRGVRSIFETFGYIFNFKDKFNPRTENFDIMEVRIQKPRATV